MAEFLAVVGGLAAGLQLVQEAAKALLLTIKFMQDLRETPKKLAVLLGDVESTMSRLCCICNAGSKAFQGLSPLQMERLSRLAGTLYPALQDIHKMLLPLQKTTLSHEKPVRRLWTAVVSLKIESTLQEKLERVNRLNLDVLRELGVVGVELQVTTTGLILDSNAASSRALSEIKDRLEVLSSEFQKLSLTVNRAHAVTNGSEEDLNRLSVGTTSRSSAISLEQEPQCSPPDHQELLRTSQTRAKLLEDYLVGSGALLTPDLTVRASIQPPSSNLEFILLGVRAFYTQGNFDSSSRLEQSEFWKISDHAIYLMKISKGQVRGSSNSETRGLSLLKKCTTDAQNILKQNTATIIIELLSTLSPVNTTTCPYVRDGLLRYLNHLAEEQLPSHHPIAVIIRQLQGDKGDHNVTLRALRSVADRLKATLGPVHQLTLLAYDRLCALLRRGREFSEAIQTCQDTLTAIRAVLGPSLLQERQMARRLEHVYIDQGNWLAALAVCFDIVGQNESAESLVCPQPLHYDECAVLTMEDIAKICENAGNVEQAIAWLKQTMISGAMIWGQNAELAHVRDKLTELLREVKREDEVPLWNGLLDVPRD